MSPAHILFKRALAEKLAFVELPPGQQAAGPGGAPVDPAAGGAPMDPSMGAPPADPMAAGMPPMDPAAGGMPPADPMAAGMPPMDPAAAGGMPPAPMDPMAGLPPEPPPPEEPPINDPATDVDKDNKPDTMVPMSAVKDFAIGVIEAMKGKKTQDAANPDLPKPEEQDPTLAPGPVTGMPGFDPASMSGGFKTASVLTRLLKSAATAKEPDYVKENTGPGEYLGPETQAYRDEVARWLARTAPRPGTAANQVIRKK